MKKVHSIAFSVDARIREIVHYIAVHCNASRLYVDLELGLIPKINFEFLDVDFYLRKNASVTFGGQVGYSKDDINKFLWMLRIADSEHVTGEFNQKRYKVR